MSSHISSSTISKLGHEIPEIRSRALKHIEGKLSRSLDLNQDLIFSPGNLVKHLIRWFGQKPLYEEEAVLKIILTILQSKYGEEAVHYLTKERLLKEFDKVDKIVQSSLAKELVYDIIEIVNESQSRSNISCSSTTTDHSQKTLLSVNSYSDILLDDTSDYEIPWSVPSSPDYNSLRLLSESLKAENADESEYAFNYLETAINDYPAEYFLQPPYIFNSLLLLTKQESNKSEILLKLLTSLTTSLSGRIKKKQLAVTYQPSNGNNKHLSPCQITAQRYSIVLFTLCVEYYKKSSEETNQPPPSQIYLLQKQILEVIANDFKFYDFRSTILIDLGNLARYYRRLYSIVDKSNALNRMLYVYMLHLIVELLNIEAKKKIQLIPTAGTCKSYYDPENYMSDSTSTNRDGEYVEIWMSELECAIFDFPLKEMCSELYVQIKSYAKVSEKNQLQLLLNCEEILGPTIDIVKKYANMNSQMFLIEGYKIVDTLLITRNRDIVNQLIDAIVDCIPAYSGNKILKEAAEKLLVKLLSHEDVQIKRTVYIKCSDNVKEFFAAAMNGEVTQVGTSFGIPLTANILTEIIYYGYSNQDNIVKTNAELILNLILKARPILIGNWAEILTILQPNLPLLQATATSQSSNLSTSLVKLYDHKDKESGLNLLEQFRGNLRFLFTNNEEIRRQALSRIIYILSVQNHSETWIPNVIQISDTLVNDVCIMDFPRQPEKMFTSGLYERSTVLALLELLRSPDVEPGIRKTTLLQLNVMCQDSELADFIHEHNGWSLALQALHNALTKNGSTDYPDAAIPAIGIITKIAICRPEFRRQLSDQLDVYYLLMRALFAYPCEDLFKQECVLLIFLLVFSSILMGSKTISIPEICRELRMPIVCKLVVDIDEKSKRGPLEQAYAELFSGVVCTPRSNHSTDFHLDMSRLNDHMIIIRECALRFIRLQFAIIWCGSFENVLSEFLSERNEHDQLRSTSRTKTSQLASLKEFLKSNSELILQPSDIETIKISTSDENLKQILYDVANAISHAQVLNCIARLQLCVIIYGKISNHRQKNILNTFKRYVMTLPHNSEDIYLFNNIIRLLTNLILVDNDHTLFLLLSELKSKHCLFLHILKSTNSCLDLYKTNCKFLEAIIKKCIYHPDQKEVKSYLITGIAGEKSNFYNELLESSLKVAEECFKQREIDRFRALLNLMQLLSSCGSIDLEEGYSLTVIQQMIDFQLKLKSFTQTGSHISKNTLLIVRNVLEDLNEVVLNEKSIKFLSSLGAHQDFEIRSLSWCIIEKISRSLKGAHSLVKVLYYLPGGFHSCCLTTLINHKETQIVRSTAGGVLSNLLTYTKDSTHGKQINITVAPLYSNHESIISNEGLELLVQLFNKHRFYEHIDDSLDNFYISEIILFHSNVKITTCELVKIYCSILINYTEINPALYQQYFEYSCFEKMFQLIKNVPMLTTDTSIDMLAAVCHLLTKFIRADERLLANYVSRDLNYIKILVELLDWSLYEKSIKPAINIVQLLRTISKETAAYSIILDSISNDKTTKFFTFIYHAVHTTKPVHQRAILDFILSLLIKGQTEIYDFQSFFDILDTKQIPDDSSIIVKNKMINANYKNIKLKYASDGLFLILNMVLCSFECSVNVKHSCEKQKLLSTCCETLAVLLKCSKRARFIAYRSYFFEYLIERFEKIFEEIGISCTDFIRKYGDAKKLPIIDEFTFIYEIIFNWHYEDALIDEKHIYQLTKIILTTWPWINHSAELRIVVMRCLAFLSENSIAVCKQFSTTILGQSATIIQQLISLLVQETLKAKSSQIDHDLLTVGIRTVTNCCSCIEGRLQCIKFNVLDIFNKFHPSLTKSQKCWNPIIRLWLEFWEIYSRYPEGAVVRYMHLLGILITKSNKDIRFKCLAILRNMAFLNSNRAALCSSEDFLYISKTILNDGSRAEQIIILVAIWRLVAGNCKAKHAIKSTSIPKKIKMIHMETMKTYCNENESDDLLNVLEILSKILE